MTTVNLNYHRHSLRFQVSQELFSSYQVDTGTRLLLKTVRDQSASDEVRKVLDLGCGYGPLGLALAASVPQRTVHLVDRDALAVAYTRRNAVENGLSNVTVYGSLGYDDVAERDFDLILSNIPGKAGPAAIASFLLDARYVLRPGGMATVVVVPPLAETVTGLLDRPGIETVLRESGSEHVVFQYRFQTGDTGGSVGRPSTTTPLESAFERGVYDRGQLEVAYRGLRFGMQTVRSLPEFDKISHQSQLLFSALQKQGSSKKEVGHALVFNPGQGHVPVALWKELAPELITVVDRDLLSLRATERNLSANGCPTQRINNVHYAGLQGGAGQAPDLILGTLRDSEGPEANYALIEQAANMLAPQGELLVAASSTTITRLEKRIKQEKLFIVRQRKRNRAKRLLNLKAR